jgi:NAD(P)-dependent dehydrogenase (short-subunit alcohol dehydrogenase family)
MARDMAANAHQPLSGKVALVAGATRGAGRAFAVELAAAGATVYATGRSSENGRSEMRRPETIEGTATRAAEAGGKAVPVVCDHLDPSQVRALVSRIESAQGRLDILVNNIWGGDHPRSRSSSSNPAVWSSRSRTVTPSSTPTIAARSSMTWRR